MKPMRPDILIICPLQEVLKGGVEKIYYFTMHTYFFFIHAIEDDRRWKNEEKWMLIIIQKLYRN